MTSLRKDEGILISKILNYVKDPVDFMQKLADSIKLKYAD